MSINPFIALSITLSTILKCTLRKTCPYLELFWSLFYLIQIEYEEIFRISPYSVRMKENADQNNSDYGHFMQWLPQASFKQETKINRMDHELFFKKVAGPTIK